MYKTTIEQCKLIIDTDLPAISNISNIVAILYHEFENINWAGLYYYNEKKNLCVLGPFQGNVACTTIPYGKGVVGTCALRKETIIVDDVHQFEGHIACDCSTNSEIVIPLLKDDKLYAILDIDSIEYNNFDKEKAAALQEISYSLSSLVSNDKTWIHLF